MPTRDPAWELNCACGYTPTTPLLQCQTSRSSVGKSRILCLFISLFSICSAYRIPFNKMNLNSFKHPSLGLTVPPALLYICTHACICALITCDNYNHYNNTIIILIEQVIQSNRRNSIHNGEVVEWPPPLVLAKTHYLQWVTLHNILPYFLGRWFADCSCIYSLAYSASFLRLCE